MTDNRTTERLMAMLEERGVSFQTHYLHVSWCVGSKLYEAVDNLDGTLTVSSLTPEQAIAATLGSGTLTAEQVREAIERHSLSYGELGRYFHDLSWQAIANELNAELGGGNCARCAEDMGRYADSLCDPLKERIAELLRCLENDWHIHASWDGLRKFWCIELTDEGVRIRDAAHGALTAEQVREAVMSADRWEKPMGDTGLTNTHLIIRDDGWQAIADELSAELGSVTCEMYRDEIGMWHCKACESGADSDGDGTLYEWCDSWAPNFCPLCGKQVLKAVGR